jgi:kynurenine formamidase
LDYGPAPDFPVHCQWLGAGHWGMECVARLDQLPAKGAFLIAGGPMIAGCSGGPSRVLALV